MCMGTVFFLSSVVRGMCLMVSVAFSVHRTTLGACYPLTCLPIGTVGVARSKAAPVFLLGCGPAAGVGQDLLLPAQRGAASPAAPSPMAVCKFGRRARSQRRWRSLRRDAPTSSPVAGCGEEATQNRISPTPWTHIDDMIHRCEGAHLVGARKRTVVEAPTARDHQLGAAECRAASASC